MAATPASPAARPARVDKARPGRISLQDKVAQCADDLQRAQVVFGHGTDNAWDEAVWMVQHITGQVAAYGTPRWERCRHTFLSDQQLSAIDALLQRRIESRTPLAYLLGYAWFAGQKFYVDRRVLVPRSYISEWLGECFAPWILPDRVHSVLDLCTGCGCIAIGAAQAFATARITASDISSAALQVAARNLRQHSLQQRVQLKQGDLFENLGGPFDLILCNPPYVSDQRLARLPPEYRCEPDIALRGGVDGLDFIERFFQQVYPYLSAEASLVLEVGSASAALEQRYPRIAFTWLSTAFDETTLLIMTRAELEQNRTAFGF